MTIYYTMHPDNPQPRLVSKAVEQLRKGGLVAYPTDTAYALGCTLLNKSALETIRQIRKLQPNHPLTLICCDIAQAAQYAHIDDKAFRYLKELTPGPYTFILPANKNVPKLVTGVKRKAVGIRIPNHAIPRELLLELAEPMLSSTLWLPDEDTPITDPQSIPQTRASCVNLVLDGGEGSQLTTTIVDLTESTPKIIREGAGDITPFEV